MGSRASSRGIHATVLDLDQLAACERGTAWYRADRRRDRVRHAVVLLRGTNHNELPAWLDCWRARGLTARFIELMWADDSRNYFQRRHLRADTLEESRQKRLT